MSTPRLLNALRDHLVTAGSVRVPATAGSPPPMWLEPKLGTPAPGEGTGNPTEVGADAVIAAYLVGGIAPQPYGSWSRWQIVELRFRTSKGYLAEDLELTISGQLIDRRAFMLGGSSGLYVVECQQNLPLQRLSSDEQGFEHLTQYVFQTYRPGYTGIS